MAATTTLAERTEVPKAMATETATELERAAAKTPAVITTPQEYRGALLRWQEQGWHIISPFANISGLQAQHGIIATLVQINTNKDAEEVYDNSGGLPWLKDGEVSLAKRGLRKIADCAGMSTSTFRTDPRTIPYFWEFKARISYRGLDGSIMSRDAGMEWDLRDGSDRLKGFQSKQIGEARKNGFRNCETRAINAAIREAGLKQKYTRIELAKPFVCVRVMYMPDMNDPETRRILTEGYVRGTAAMYPELPAGHVIDVEAQPTSTAAADGAQSRATTGGVADPDKPPTPNAVRVARVEKSTGVTNGKGWTKWEVTDSNGVVQSTFSRTHGENAEAYGRERTWVEIDTEQKGDFRNIVDILPAGQQATLPDMGNL